MAKNILVITEDKSFNIPKFNIITDDYELPVNIKLTKEADLVNKNIIFTKKLPSSKKYQVIKNLKTYLEIHSTKDILPYL